jgi:DNA end-binding protein Ku
MVRSVWSGTLSFGLVAIPVRLVPATEPKDIRFHLVDAESGRRVRYRRFVESEPGQDAAPTDADAPRSNEGSFDEGRPVESRAPIDAVGSAETGTPLDHRRPVDIEVPFDALARGYEVEPGTMVALTPDELRAARPTPSRTIEIEDFVQLDAIDPVYFEKSYVVVPQTGGTADRPYALLLRTLEEAGRVGIGRFVLRTRPHLVAVRPRAGAIGLETLFFSDEVRDPSHMVDGLDTGSLGERELKMARQLVDMLSTDWEPARYADTYREELRSLIARKTPKPRPQPIAAPTGRPSDAERLMDALRESVERAKRGADASAAVSTSSSR